MIKPLVITALGVWLLAGCASLDQQQCRHADWEQMGRADASQGKHPSALEAYRKDCAEYAIMADSTAYHRGYQQGLTQFCRANSGFYYGRQGKTYAGICPAPLEDDFLRGYQQGRTHYQQQKAWDQLRQDLRRETREIDRLRQRIEAKEAQLVSEPSSARRQQLLDQLRHDRYQLRERRQQLHTYRLEYDRLELRHPTQPFFYTPGEQP